MTPRSAVASVLADADRWLVDQVNQRGMPGLAVGVVHDGDLVYAKGFGYADAGTSRPVTPDTFFRLASISKTLTAIALMQLWEEGRFGLDDPVNGHLKTVRVAHRDPAVPPVTFRHLLTHTAGVGEVRRLRDFANVRNLWYLAVPEDTPVPPAGEYYRGLLRAELAPGKKWAYANHGFAVLGQLVEDISGRPFVEYMRERVFGPLGMPDSDYLRTDHVREGLATGLHVRKGRVRPARYNEIAVRAAGSAFSTVREMANYLAALMEGGRNQHGAVLKPETLDMMMEPQYVADPRLSASMGLAFFLDRFGDHRIASHNGGWTGYSSAMYVAPDDRLGVIMFTNVSSLALDGVATGLLRRLLAVPVPASASGGGLLESPQVHADLCGYYGPQPGFLTNARVWMAFGGEVEIFVSGNTLMARGAAGPLRRGVALRRADPQDPLLYEATFEGMTVQVAFGRNGAGEVDRLSAAGVMGFYNWEKRPAAQSVSVRGRAAVGAAAAGLLLATAKLCRGRCCRAGGREGGR